MSRFENAFRAPTPGSTRTSAQQSVQASLYGRLKRRYGDTAGDVGWLLIRAAQPEHRDHEEARAMLASREADELAFLASVASASVRAMAARAECAALAEAVRKAISDIGITKAAAARIDWRALAKKAGAE